MDQWTHEYLKKLYNAGYRYIATDKDCETFAYSRKPVKRVDIWKCDSKKDLEFREVFDLFGTSWKDEQPFDIEQCLKTYEGC